MQRGSECKPSWQDPNLWEQKQSKSSRCVSVSVSIIVIKHRRVNTPLFILQWKASRVSAFCWWETPMLEFISLTQTLQEMQSFSIVEINFIFTAAVDVVDRYVIWGHVTSPGPDQSSSLADLLLKNPQGTILAGEKKQLYAGFHGVNWFQSAQNYQTKPAWRPDQYNPASCSYLAQINTCKPL